MYISHDGVDNPLLYITRIMEAIYALLGSFVLLLRPIYRYSSGLMRLYWRESDVEVAGRNQSNVSKWRLTLRH